MGDAEPTSADVDAATEIDVVDMALEMSGSRDTFYRCADGRCIRKHEQMNDWDYEIRVSLEWITEEEATARRERLHAEKASFEAMMRESDEKSHREACARRATWTLRMADAALVAASLGLIIVWFAATQRIGMAVCAAGLTTAAAARGVGPGPEFSPCTVVSTVGIAVPTAFLILLGEGGAGPDAPWWTLRAAWAPLAVWCLVRVVRILREKPPPHAFLG